MITIDLRSAVPPYEQIRAQVVGLVASGELAPETRLPTVRKLADDLDLAPGTVARAFRELEQAGIIETRGRKGTFVAAYGDPALVAAQRAAAVYATQIRSLGIRPAEGIELVRAALASALDADDQQVRQRIDGPGVVDAVGARA